MSTTSTISLVIIEAADCQSPNNYQGLLVAFNRARALKRDLGFFVFNFLYSYALWLHILSLTTFQSVTENEWVALLFCFGHLHGCFFCDFKFDIATSSATPPKNSVLTTKMPGFQGEASEQTNKPSMHINSHINHQATEPNAISAPCFFGRALRTIVTPPPPRQRRESERPLGISPTNYARGPRRPHVTGPPRSPSPQRSRKRRDPTSLSEETKQTADKKGANQKNRDIFLPHLF